MAAPSGSVPPCPCPASSTSTAAVMSGATWSHCATHRLNPAEQPTLFELREDHRPPGERNAAERYCEPSLFAERERNC